MKQQFLENFFPTSRAANIRKDICGIRQLQGETLYEYWERFKKLCASCSQHQIYEQLLVQYFYEGLSVFYRNMIDAASGGALVNKTPQEASDLIPNMVSNAQQFRTREDNAPRHVKEETRSSIQNLGNKITQLATSVSNLEAQNSGKLPSETVINPRENASAMVLRSGKKIEIGSLSPIKSSEGKGMEKEVEDTSEDQTKVKSTSLSSDISNVVVPPFSARLEKSKKADYENEVLETFIKVEINISLIDAIKQIPIYAKFLKDLCTNKRD
ncbi:uncharacterized protein [Henckelia pumila]|uniref:uncharacterized protein n=1 Tax=Henckelia pumila TaxID=405737 RepID=UPI003C6DC253